MTFFTPMPGLADEIDLKGVADSLALNTNGFIRSIRNPEIRRLPEP